jgi:predicted RNA-binding protein YlqC (UPF0109 family)
VPDDEEKLVEEVEPGEAEEAEETGTASIPVPSISYDEDGSPMRDMVEYIARALVSDPDSVQVIEEDDDGRTVYRLTVDEKDKGKIIGRDGRVAQSIRSLLRVAATKSGTRVTLEIE